MDMISVVSLGVGFIGVLLTIYFGKKASKLENEKKKLHWDDLQNAASDLKSQLIREFQPDVIFTPGVKGGIIAHLISEKFDTPIPTFVGVSVWHGDNKGLIDFKDFYSFSTNKWTVYIPNVIFDYKNAKVLIVDDFAMSGDFVDNVRNLLIKNGFQESHIKVLCIVTTKVAISNHKAPDYYWKITDSDDFYFPWGKAR